METHEILQTASPSPVGSKHPGYKREKGSPPNSLGSRARAPVAKDRSDCGLEECGFCLLYTSPSPRD
eukprot:12418667-Alexandrium_andersonii.AAC.1